MSIIMKLIIKLVAMRVGGRLCLQKSLVERRYCRDNMAVFVEFFALAGRKGGTLTEKGKKLNWGHKKSG